MAERLTKVTFYAKDDLKAWLDALADERRLTRGAGEAARQLVEELHEKKVAREQKK